MSETCGATTANQGECKNPAGDNGRCWIPTHNPDNTEDNPHGRPSKLDDHEGEIIQSAKSGMTIENCANAAGITEQTLYNWLDEHEDFFEAFKRARREGAQKLIQQGLHEGNGYDSQFARFLLQASHGYVKTERREVTGEGGGGIEIVLGDDDE